MKKSLLLLGAVVAASVLLSPASFAQDEELPDPGLTPDSPFYFLDDFWKSVRLTFTRNAEKQTELRMEFAQEKLAEMRQMAAEKKDAALARATLRYEEHLAEINDRLENADLTDEQQARIEERLAVTAERHQQALDRIEENVSNFAQGLLDRARDRSHEQRVRALQRLREHRPDRTVEIASGAIESRAEHLRKLLENPNLTEGERIRIEERLSQLEEISALGEDTLERIPGNIRDRLRNAFEQSRLRASNRLSEIIERAPEQALPGLENALERIRTIDQPRDLEQIRREVNEFRERRESERPDVCIQVITPARNPRTGEIRRFPTPCDVPEGWERVSPEALRLREREDGSLQNIITEPFDETFELRRRAEDLR